MFVKTILCCSVLAVLTVLSQSATRQQFKPLPRPAVRRDQKTFQQIQNILRKKYERTLRQEHEHFRRRNSRFLRADPLTSRYRRPGRTVVRRQRKIQAGPTAIKVSNMYIRSSQIIKQMLYTLIEFMSIIFIQNYY